ncbi:DUF1496 domain-containing protein [Marinomonas sp.]
MMKKSLCIATLFVASCQAMAEAPVKMEVPYNKTSFCIYAGTVYSEGSVIKVKDSKKEITCVKNANGAYWK